MERLDELEMQIDEELQKLETTLDEYEQTLSAVDGTLSESTLEDTDSPRRYSATGAD
ncbi:hypothetical protein [Halovenus halobia]|uniref:hypothetical protein n=1 Tax=Halovenus halobia TaxID=3396622 RepID=UPI003F575FB5